MPAATSRTNPVQRRPTVLPDRNRFRALRDEPRFVKEDDMLRLAATTTAITVTAALAITACGSGHSDADDVRATTLAYYHALLGPNPIKACALLTPHGREQIESPAAVSCEAASRLFPDLTSPRQRAAVDRIQVHAVTFADDHTRAIIADEDVTLPPVLGRNDNGRPTILVKQRDGRWLIEDLGS
jgi:hypothetical protein